MDSQATLYFTGVVALTFLVLFIVYVVKYNNAKDDQHCTLVALGQYTATGTKTLTAASSVQAQVTLLTNNAAFTITFPSVASIITQINSVAATTCKPLTLTIANLSTQAFTFPAVTGVTVGAPPTTGNFTVYQIDKTSDTTVTYTALSTGAVTALA
jgi:hypothetical protein